MGNTLDVCEHLLNDLYPQIFSYLSPQDLVAVSLTSKRFLHHVTDEVPLCSCLQGQPPKAKMNECKGGGTSRALIKSIPPNMRQVWKELCRRDFGGQLEAHRQARRGAAPSSPAAAGDGDKGQHSKDDGEGGGDGNADEGDEHGEPSSLFRKVLLTGLALRLRRGISGGAADGKVDDQALAGEDAMDVEHYYKKLYRKWLNQVLIVYHVFSNDEAEKDVENVLRLHGVEGTFS
jgi:hypothetical protein